MLLNSKQSNKNNFSKQVCKKMLPPEGTNKTKFQRKVTINENGYECNKSLACPKQNISKTSSKLSLNSNRGKNKSFGSDFDITILPMTAPNTNIHLQPIESDITTERIVKPISGYEGYSGEWKEFADIISKVKRLYNKSDLLL